MYLLCLPPNKLHARAQIKVIIVGDRMCYFTSLTKLILHLSLLGYCGKSTLYSRLCFPDISYVSLTMCSLKVMWQFMYHLFPTQLNLHSMSFSCYLYAIYPLDFSWTSLNICRTWSLLRHLNNLDGRLTYRKTHSGFRYVYTIFYADSSIAYIVWRAECFEDKDYCFCFRGQESQLCLRDTMYVPIKLIWYDAYGKYWYVWCRTGDNEMVGGHSLLN